MDAGMREAVVAEAMSWLRTPYHHGAGLKGIGTDCARFPLAVYAEAGAIPPTDVGVYARDWHLHHGEELYLGWLNRLATEIERDALAPGDFVVWRFGRTFSHGAIVVDPPLVIHAYIGVGVTLDDMDGHSELLTRPARCFTLWPEKDPAHGR